MSDDQAKGVSYEDLEVFRRAYALSLVLHRATAAWPKTEQFGGLADQLRRASKSVCGLIAEGSGRRSSSKAEFARYLTMAVGSAEEARLWCRYAIDLEFVGPERGEAWRQEWRDVIRMLEGLKNRVLRSRHS